MLIFGANRAHRYGRFSQRFGTSSASKRHNRNWEAGGRPRIVCVPATTAVELRSGYFPWHHEKLPNSSSLARSFLIVIDIDHMLAWGRLGIFLWYPGALSVSTSNVLQFRRGPTGILPFREYTEWVDTLFKSAGALLFVLWREGGGPNHLVLSTFSSTMTLLVWAMVEVPPMLLLFSASTQWQKFRVQRTANV